MKPVSLKSPQRWPVPKYAKGNEPHFLFIVTPPYSGSTALCELLNTSHRTMTLEPKGEAQWLVPGMCETDRWDPDKEIDYESVKAVWLSRFQEVRHLVKNVDVIIEKSPPNMVRIKPLSAQFRNVSFLANNRDPYANCASILYRHHDADSLAAKKRLAILKRLVLAWIEKSGLIRDIVEELGIPLITYEEFCKDPAGIIGRIALPPGVAESVDPGAKVKVKDYKPQRISNQNPRQIARLNTAELKLLTGLLKKEQPLLSFYGYRTL